MVGPPRDDRLLREGPFGTVEYAVRSDGETMEAKLWLEAQSTKIQASFDVLFRRLVEQGRITNETQFRHLEDSIWEFKRAEHRLLCFQHGRRWLLTHRIKKAGGQGKCPPREIRHADTVGREHLAWEASQEESEEGKQEEAE